MSALSGKGISDENPAGRCRGLTAAEIQEISNAIKDSNLGHGGEESQGPFHGLVELHKHPDSQ